MGNNYRDFTYIDDLIDNLLKLLNVKKEKFLKILNIFLKKLKFLIW